MMKFKKHLLAALASLCMLPLSAADVEPAYIEMAGDTVCQIFV